MPIIRLTAVGIKRKLGTMPVHIYLDAAAHILRITYIDPWNVEELTANFAEEQALLEATPYVLHTLIDLTQAHHVPRGTLRARESPVLQHPNSGYIAVIGASL